MDGWEDVKAVLRNAYSNQNSVSMGGWMEGWMEGWVDLKAVLRIAYSNQK